MTPATQQLLAIVSRDPITETEQRTFDAACDALRAKGYVTPDKSTERITDEWPIVMVDFDEAVEGTDRS